MCGIFGVYSRNQSDVINKASLNRAVSSLKSRGPDSSGIFISGNCGLGHTRLSVIDVSDRSNQPMTDEKDRYTLVFNGEIYNFKEIRRNLQEKGIVFYSDGDTEVLLKAYILYGKECLKHFNGCFAFAIYDKLNQHIFIARDRLGIKPLVYYYDGNQFLFASEIKALIEYGIPREMENLALPFYFQLNYIPAPLSIFKNVFKLLPGQYIEMNSQGYTTSTYWVPPLPENQFSSYQTSSIKQLLSDAVERRLISDVPIGTFLSGGIDSAIITGLAKRLKPDITAFSVAYPEDKLYDEGHWASVTAKFHHVDHHIFNVTSKDLYENFENFLTKSDEPFADSSAVAVNMLSKLTRQKVTVALSGDGADELFGGYNKHSAHYRVLQNRFSDKILTKLSPVFGLMSGARSNKTSNYIRKIKKFSYGYQLSHKDRYWLWCSLMSETEIKNLIIPKYNNDDYQFYKTLYLGNIEGRSMNEILHSDVRLVLPNDMLTKVDKYSMSEALEVRVPFLDYTVVEFAMKLPDYEKINKKSRKIILRNEFSDLIPPLIQHRPKHGFEIPVEKWLKNEMFNQISEFSSKNHLQDQGIFNSMEISKIVSKLNSSMPGDSPAQLWAFLLFQYWWKKYMN